VSYIFIIFLLNEFQPFNEYPENSFFFKLVSKKFILYIFIAKRLGFWNAKVNLAKVTLPYLWFQLEKVEFQFKKLNYLLLFNAKKFLDSACLFRDYKVFIVVSCELIVTITVKVMILSRYHPITVTALPWLTIGHRYPPLRTVHHRYRTLTTVSDRYRILPLQALPALH
jgi:hypothetical protein